MTRARLPVLLILALASLDLPAESVGGTLVDADRRPVAGARVRLSGAAERVALTNQGGAFSFDGLAAGTYRIRMEIEGAVVLPAAERELSLGPGGVAALRFAAVGAPVTPIPRIQGRGHLSPLNRTAVASVPGVVTALRGRLGFYMQSPSPDGDDGTSEGILVTSIRLPSVRPGDLVLVDGDVVEYYGGGVDSGDLSVTRLETSRLRVLLSGVEVPAPVILGQAGRRVPDRVICDDASGNAEHSLYDPENDGIDFFESLEGMLVRVDDAVVVGSVHTSYGEFQVVGDGGRLASSMTRRGGLILAAGDQNPERITVDARGEPDVAAQRIPDLVVGDRFTASIVGPLDYNYSDYKILPLAPLARATPALLPREKAPDVRAPLTLTVATLNLGNFSAASPQEKIRDIAATVVGALHCPDLLALQEVQDDSGAQDDGVVSAAKTYRALIDAVAAAGGRVRYEVREMAPENNQDGGEPGGNIRVALLFDPERVRFVDRPIGPWVGVEAREEAGGVRLTGSPGRVAPLHASMVDSRKPLACEVEFAGRRIFVVVVHLASKSGDPQVYARSHPVNPRSERVRSEQAERIAELVASILAIDPGALVVALGDFNEYAYAPPMLALKRSGLHDLAEELLPPEERYSYVYRGNSQDLDHILVSRALLEGASPRVWIPHRYAEYLYGVRQTDHDPVLAALSFPAAPGAGGTR